VTIVTYSRMVFYAEAAAEKLAARITEVTFRDLTAPVLRITAKDVAVLADSMDEC
jgi:pyruvate/2-oxoglutarate/acetoin dehydrogenase E1 component